MAEAKAPARERPQPQDGHQHHGFKRVFPPPTPNAVRRPVGGPVPTRPVTGTTDGDATLVPPVARKAYRWDSGGVATEEIARLSSSTTLSSTADSLATSPVSVIGDCINGSKCYNCGDSPCLTLDGFGRGAAPKPNKRALYVGGLEPRVVTEDVLRQIFETTGHVQNVKIIPDIVGGALRAELGASLSTPRLLLNDKEQEDLSIIQFRWRPLVEHDLRRWTVRLAENTKRPIELSLAQLCLDDMDIDAANVANAAVIVKTGYRKRPHSPLERGEGSKRQ
ncbi:hypothetical protein QR685DRAFT_566123 [Neurospora intermedia]|uniref:RRM domain-containing protein n=1 Tax=Neurospora intermedia TaxID=5142 RepID=A0ABR3D3B4_NEUIN